jgi:hypothetical protein
MTDTETERKVLAYVRLCGDENRDCREINIKIPDGISQAELLAEGFAIDGHSASKSVTDYTDDGTYVPLSEALLDCQREIVAWFAERGFAVEFR